MKTMVRYTPVDRFFDELWNTMPMDCRVNIATPALDVVEADDAVEVRVNLPGIDPDTVNIEFEKGVLTIETQLAPAGENDAQPRYTHRERFAGAYKRSLRIPESLDTENASAEFHYGVLILRLPKKPEAQPIRIPVKAAR